MTSYVWIAPIHVWAHAEGVNEYLSRPAADTRSRGLWKGFSDPNNTSGVWVHVSER